MSTNTKAWIITAAFAFACFAAGLLIGTNL
jgi:hypothetical protein